MRRKAKQAEGTAILVDGDNLPPDVLPPLVARLEGEGPVIERRIWRNWRSTKDSQVWDQVAKDHAFERVDRYNTRREGKNASDIAVAVGAMDLFHQGCRSFCIVSGDTDFVPLVERLRRGGAKVTIVGHHKDAGLLEQVSDEYLSAEELVSGKARDRRQRPGGARPPRETASGGGRSAGKRPAAKQPAKQPKQQPAKGQAKKGGRGGQGGKGPQPGQEKALKEFLIDVYESAMEEGAADDQGWIFVDRLGKMAHHKDASFAPKRYGLPASTKFTDCFQRFKDTFVVHSMPAKGGQRLRYRVRRR